MSRKSLTTACVALLAAAVMLLSASTAQAQILFRERDVGFSQGGGFGSGGNYGYEGRGYWTPPAMTYYPAPMYFTPTYSYYAPPSIPVSTNVQISLDVPANAMVWFDEKSTSQTGANRFYVSPPLEPGVNYSYQIKVTWRENGHDVTRVRDVPVHAGDVLNLRFGPNVVAAAR